MKHLGISLWLLLLIIFILSQGSYASNVIHSLEREVIPYPIRNEFKYDFWFNQFSIEFDIPEGLLKEVSRHETGGSFDRNIIGCSGDLGLMQLNPIFMQGDFEELHRDYKGYYTAGIDFDWQIPQHNIMLGAYKLMRNYKEYGNWIEALSAYNQGTGNHKKYGTRWEYVNQIDWRDKND